MNFSLRQLLVLMTSVCAYVAVVWALPPGLSLLCLGILTGLLPAMSLGGILYARGNWRAFWCGVAICGAMPATIGTWWVVLLVLDNPELVLGLLADSDEFERDFCYPFALLHGFSLAAGLAVVTMRRIYKPSRGLRPW